jgi:hypothetical protein
MTPTDTTSDTTSDSLVNPRLADHAIDGVCALAIAATAFAGAATDATTAGLVSIALGKRLLPSRNN